jgi:hypothetical protein
MNEELHDPTYLRSSSGSQLVYKTYEGRNTHYVLLIIIYNQLH